MLEILAVLKLLDTAIERSTVWGREKAKLVNGFGDWQLSFMTPGK